MRTALFDLGEVYPKSGKDDEPMSVLALGPATGRLNPILHVVWPRVPHWRYGDYEWHQNERIVSSDPWEYRPRTNWGPQVGMSDDAKALTADDARRIADGWLYVARHWDELVGHQCNYVTVDDEEFGLMQVCAYPECGNT